MGTLAEGTLLSKDESRLRKDSARSLVGVPNAAVVTDCKRGSSSGSAREAESPRVNKKFIENWRHACDRTKDRTKELLKKWRTLPEPGADESYPPEEENKGWSEHVWTTWVKRCPSGEGSVETGITSMSIELTNVHKEKLANFFIHFLDMDCDDVISICDFENLFERFRHFADWSKNSAEYHRLLEVQKGFVECFLLPPDMVDETHSYDALEKAVRKEQLEMDEWLHKWNQLMIKAKNFMQLPLWLQYFPIILFQVINKSGSGFISQEELSTFYTSVVGLTEQQINAVSAKVYGILTSNGSHNLDMHVYRLSFANFIFGRYPNGPGQWLLYPLSKADQCFPIDYKAMGCAPQDLEQYSPRVKTDRRSVIV